MKKLKETVRRYRWLVLALVIANEIRGVIVVVTIAPQLFKAVM